MQLSMESQDQGLYFEAIADSMETQEMSSM